MRKVEKWLQGICENDYSGFYLMPTIMIHEEGVFIYWLKKQATIIDWCKE
jgi:hypothetical protein